MQNKVPTSLISLLLAAIIGGGVGGVGAVWWMSNHTPGQRVAIINVGALAQRVSKSLRPQAQDFKVAFQQSDKIAAALAEKGYIVLNSGAVMAAPDGLYTPKPIRLEQPVQQTKPAKPAKPAKQARPASQKKQ